MEIYIQNRSSEKNEHIYNKLGQFLWDEEEFELSPMKAAKLIKKNSRA